MALYIDAHVHLADASFNKDLDDVISRAKEIGVKGAVVVSEFPGDCERIIQLSEKYPGFCFPCLGVHPVQGEPAGERRSASFQDLEVVSPLIDKYHEQLVAIGEVGLDFTPRYCKTDEDKETQRTILKKQVELALKYNLPVNVHSRSAGRPTVALLKECGAKHVLMHAFDGRPSVAMEGVKAGFFFSIPPSIVRSPQKSKLVQQLPIENILLETDSPGLAPNKEERNELKNIQISCEYIAKVKSLDVETVARITFENTLRLFPKLKALIK